METSTLEDSEIKMENKICDFFGISDFENLSTTYHLDQMVHATQFISSESSNEIAFQYHNDLAVLDIKSGVINRLKGHRDKILFIRVYDANTLVTASGDGAINLWNPYLTRDNWINYLSSSRNQVCGLAVSCIDGVIVSITKDGYLNIWNKVTKVYQTSILVDRKGLSSVVLDDHEKLILVGGLGRIYAYDSINYTHVTTLGEHNGPLHAMSTFFNKTNSKSYLLSAGEDKTLILWDVQKFSVQRKMYGHSSSVTCVEVFNPYDAVTESLYPIIISGSRDRSIRVWNFNNGNLIRTLFGHDERVISLSVSFFINSGMSSYSNRHPNGSSTSFTSSHPSRAFYLVSSSSDKKMKVWYIYKVINWERRRYFCMFLKQSGYLQNSRNLNHVADNTSFELLLQKMENSLVSRNEIEEIVECKRCDDDNQDMKNDISGIEYVDSTCKSTNVRISAKISPSADQDDEDITRMDNHEDDSHSSGNVAVQKSEFLNSFQEDIDQCPVRCSSVPHPHDRVFYDVFLVRYICTFV